MMYICGLDQMWTSNNPNGDQSRRNLIQRALWSQGTF